jgi:hypothetical protein
MPLGHRADKWTRFSALNDAPAKSWSIGLIPKVESTSGSDALGQRRPPKAFRDAVRVQPCYAGRADFNGMRDHGPSYAFAAAHGGSDPLFRRSPVHHDPALGRCRIGSCPRRSRDHRRAGAFYLQRAHRAGAGGLDRRRAHRCGEARRLLPAGQRTAGADL